MVDGTVDGTTYDREPVTLGVGTHRVTRDTELTFPAGATVPHAESLEASSNDLWSTPLPGAGGPRPPGLRDLLADPGAVPRHHGPAARPGPLLHQPGRSRGPPHDADRAGPARRRSTSSRPCTARWPGLHAGPAADRATPTPAVLLLPERAGRRGRRPPARRAGDGGRVRRVPVHVVRPHRLGRRRALAGRAAAGRCATSGSRPSLAVVVPFVLSLLATSTRRRVVGLAFAVAASSFCPLLVLGIWWRGLTDAGAAAGLLVGGGLATAAVSATIAGRGPRRAGPARCSPSRPRGPCRWRSPSWWSSRCARRRRVPRRTSAARWSGCTHPSRCGSSTDAGRGSAPATARRPLGPGRGPFGAAGRPLGDEPDKGPSNGCLPAVQSDPASHEAGRRRARASLAEEAPW